MKAHSNPSTAAGDGRRTNGRFTAGNSFGQGNPHARQAEKLRSALFAAVTEEDLRDVVAALIKEAKAGNVQAAREVLDRTLGKPEAYDVAERLEALETLLEALKGSPV